MGWDEGADPCSMPCGLAKSFVNPHPIESGGGRAQTVLDALRARKERFVFEDVEVALKPSVMAFITMNPGYPGRAELPESLKVAPRFSCDVDII